MLQLLSSTDLKGRNGRTYFAAPELIAAANAALVLQVPLLLTGEPGCGKTDFAHVVAESLGAPFYECYVRSDTRARDLLYSYDALRRFGDAQHHSVAEDRQRAADPRNYVHLNGLGLALTWPGPAPAVVLIDEMDKAPRDLPNDLLRELDRERGDFEIAELDAGLERRLGARMIDEFDDEGQSRVSRAIARHMRRPAGAPMPFVVITSNAERQLPDPFLRRCVFYHIDFPDEARLLDIVRDRNRDRDRLFIEQAIKVFVGLRGGISLTKPPSTSELLHWVEVLGRLHDPKRIGELLRDFAARLASADGERPHWRTLPALSCLIKLQADLERLT